MPGFPLKHDEWVYMCGDGMQQSFCTHINSVKLLQMHTYTCGHIIIHTEIVDTLTHTQTHTHTHTYTHTHTHTHTYCTHTLAQPTLPGGPATPSFPGSPCYGHIFIMHTYTGGPCSTQGAHAVHRGHTQYTYIHQRYTTHVRKHIYM